jgi:hypothetical protein
MSSNNFRIIIKSDTGTGNNDSRTYFYDFNKHKQGLYKLKFKFIALENDIDPAKFGQIKINWGSENMYETVLNKNPTGTFYIGLLTPVTVGVSGYLKADPNDNFEVILQKPSSNYFTVSLEDMDNGVYRDEALADINDYMMDLYFEKI